MLAVGDAHDCKTVVCAESSVIANMMSLRFEKILTTAGALVNMIGVDKLSNYVYGISRITIDNLPRSYYYLDQTDFLESWIVRMRFTELIDLKAILSRSILAVGEACLCS